MRATSGLGGWTPRKKNCAVARFGRALVSWSAAKVAEKVTRCEDPREASHGGGWGAAPPRKERPYGRPERGELSLVEP
jgi:hypothetical protein